MEVLPVGNGEGGGGVQSSGRENRAPASAKDTCRLSTPGWVNVRVFGRGSGVLLGVWDLLNVPDVFLGVFVPGGLVRVGIALGHRFARRKEGERAPLAIAPVICRFLYAPLLYVA